MNENTTNATRGTQTTVDLDNPTGCMVLQVWYSLSNLGTVTGRISASGNGVHLRCIHPFQISFADSILIRQQHSDDVQRLWFDMQAPESKPRMILFDVKRGNIVDDWMDDPNRLTERYGAMI